MLQAQVATAPARASANNYIAGHNVGGSINTHDEDGFRFQFGFTLRENRLVCESLKLVGDEIPKNGIWTPLRDDEIPSAVYEIAARMHGKR